MMIRSNAKVNLTLRITGKDKKDGYHYIDSVFDTIALHDKIQIRKSPSGIVINDKLKKLGIPQEQNIMYRAARAVLDTGRIRAGIVIDLYKHIPDGAGLGGGSSNAAAVIKGLIRLFKARIPGSRVRKIAAKLGSDVPFFLTGGKAVVSGKGEKIRQIRTKRKLWYVLACPGQKVNTKYAYKLYDTRNRLTNDNSYNKLVIQYLTGKIGFEKARFYNDFEPVIMAKYRSIRAAKSLLAMAGAKNVLMSGSGSTVYAVFAGRDEAKKVFNKVKNSRRGWFFCLTCSA